MPKKPPPVGKVQAMSACKRLIDKLDGARWPASEIDTCKAVGIPGNIMSRWRQGKKVHLDHIWRLAQKLGLSLDYLADDEATEPPQPVTELYRDCLRAIQTLGEESAWRRLIQAADPSHKPEGSTAAVTKKTRLVSTEEVPEEDPAPVAQANGSVPEAPAPKRQSRKRRALR